MSSSLRAGGDSSKVGADDLGRKLYSMEDLRRYPTDVATGVIVGIGSAVSVLALEGDSLGALPFETWKAHIS